MSRLGESAGGSAGQRLGNGWATAGQRLGNGWATAGQRLGNGWATAWRVKGVNERCATADSMEFVARTALVYVCGAPGRN
ncbi:hypothetical protein [Alicyclobacillus sp. ALC3]|uniref:hypothetical protein n=1 Tax=Alicyclobacillus sp. ALC3 TaxID=2796143 RepID=UPI0023793872|nr:hypothetical protein [Alicyclobacillus sp. ALC3]WDL99130.1 hypothetical protein JC200_11055 [Alicyclobacillus sp. ALC3]